MCHQEAAGGVVGLRCSLTRTGQIGTGTGIRLVVTATGRETRTGSLSAAIAAPLQRAVAAESGTEIAPRTDGVVGRLGAEVALVTGTGTVIGTGTGTGTEIEIAIETGIVTEIGIEIHVGTLSVVTAAQVGAVSSSSDSAREFSFLRPPALPHFRITRTKLRKS